MRKMILGAACLVAATAADAEDVDLVGTFPAGNPQVAMLRSIAITPFDGRHGPAVSTALERLLMAPEADGRPYFLLRPDGRAAEGVVTGNVRMRVDESDYDTSRSRCAEKDERGKCVRKEKYDVPCRRRTVDLSVDARVADRRASAVIYSQTVSHSDTDSYCEDESAPDSVGDTVHDLVNAVAGELRGEFAPVTRRYSVRFRETTKGLDKPAAAQFKAIVRQSQRDLPSACAGWAAIDRASPDHVATVFDLGVCAEARGDLMGALTRYERASALLGRGNEAEGDANRVRQLLAAREDAERRARP